MTDLLLTPLAATRVAAPTRAVRALLPRTGTYTVKTLILAASISSQIVDEQLDSYVRETVAWAMGRFNVMPVSGGRVSKSVTGVSVDVEARIIRAVGNDQITMRAALAAVYAELAPIYGHQVRITGWMPGYTTAEGRTVLEILDDPCPSCTVNPSGYTAGDATTARCLNSEDCGWTSN
jgi:hypothetical protein